ncbi:MAG: hypothetical protein KF764_18310 [Labilithrix sp.]|nr:hypothetical protein [Labilithrix sp.]MBX3224354.1 hypothetical protein [Labilithrix sp.]
MRLAILSSLMLSVLFAATGCSVSGQATRHSSLPSSNIADTSRDPSWTPPGEMDLTIGDAPVAQTKTDVAESMPQPNKREILRHQLHAATY